ncbi:MAG: osmotically inducible protein OsmC [Chloroflexota bacterium]|nr:MAG: osmotically inducible protein OsmC [Chloroflexota bacterium]HDD61992.1 OsmC family peroxiredoxin [Chloroflexota bacterium]
MNAKVEWKGRMSFTGSSDSGFNIPLGASPEVGGDDDGFRPMELMAVSLAGCTAMDVISILKKKRQEVSNFQVKVETDRAVQHPKVFTSAVIEYHVAGKDISESAVSRAMELSADTYCPAQAMIGKIIPLSLKYFIYEGDKFSDTKLVVEGQLK